jgi:hypothetical protein
LTSRRSIPRLADHGRADLLSRLQSRRPEIQAAALNRVYTVSDPSEVVDPEYVDGLRVAVSSALDYGFAAVEQGERSAPPIPVALRAQARLAARNAISLDTVLRRYFAGYSLLSDFLIEEAEEGGLMRGEELKRLLHSQSTLFDRVIAAVSDEYNRESEDRFASREDRRAEFVKRLLAGEQLDSAELAYDLDSHHLGAIASGPGAEEAIKDLTEELGHRLLLIRRDEEKVWAWIGARRGFDPTWFERFSSEGLPAEVLVAFGEPGEDINGWRLSHQQARAAMAIALRGRKQLVRYADVALVASMLQDDLLSASLRKLYLMPLATERDGGEVLRQTLRAYFAAGRNASSAAASLGVSRRTVTNRLRAIEARLERPLGSAGAEIETALRFHELQDIAAHT